MVWGRKQKPEQPAEAATSAAVEIEAAADAVLRDSLGLYHLWYLERRLQEELVRAPRNNSYFSLATWRLRMLPGETPSPELFARAASLISNRLRSYDVYARIGENRLIAILYDADFQTASTVAFRIKADMQVGIASSGRWQAGVATFPADGVDSESLINAASRRLAEDARAA